MINKITTLIFILVLAGYSFGQVEKSDKTELIQLSGIIVEQGDSLYGIPGAHIFNPKTGRGATTNILGYFSLPVKPGDSLLVASVGFEKQAYIVPSDSIQHYSIIFPLSTDIMILPEARISRLPTERAFKQALLALNLPEDDYKNMSRNIDDQLLENMYDNMALTGSHTYTYSMQEQVRMIEQQYLAQSISLLDPFAWSRFVRDVKAEKKKKEEDEKEEKANSPY